MRKFNFLFLLVPFILFNSCVTMNDFDYSKIDSAINSSDYVTASELLESHQGYYYTSKENVLLHLDNGIIKHFARDYEKSNEHLSLAEKEIEENFTKSVTQKIGQGIVNDNVAEYAGETYEDIYTNIFMCLNYIHLNKIDDAMVEIRRFDNKMKVIGLKYQSILEESRNQLKSEYEYNDTQNIDSEITFHNSAFARYMSMLLYRNENDYNSAQIDYKKIEEAFELQKTIYNFEMPKSIKEELSIPQNKARVNFVSMIGRCPIKKEEVLRIPFEDAYYKLALPVLTFTDTKVSYIEVELKNKSTGKIEVDYLEMIESVENIMKDLFKQHYAAIYIRTLLRSIGKSTSSLVFDSVSEQTSDANVSVLFSFLNLISQIATEVSERADVRNCRYFPELICVGGINVDPGTYEIKINYYDNNKRFLYSDYQGNFVVEKNKLNFVESVYQN